MSTDVFGSNLDLYNAAAEASFWAESSGLQAAETNILNVLRDRLPSMEMLDMGIGGGRTTAIFAPLVKGYAGGDFAPAMVEISRKRFPDLDLSVTNAVDLRRYTGESFDFVLFSYNGLDYVNAGDRQRALLEFRRVLRPGGYLAFSSHNLSFYPALARSRKISFSWHPRRMAGSIKRYLQFHARNRAIRYTPQLASGVVFEGQLEFGAPTYYIRPSAQVKALQALGMRDIRLFPNEGGEVSPHVDGVDAVQDPWIYYLCRKPAPASET
jgi:ubiquinone/menaquinone biosynthesis C-methylase UbiE